MILPDACVSSPGSFLRHRLSETRDVLKEIFGIFGSFVEIEVFKFCTAHLLNLRFAYLD